MSQDTLHDKIVAGVDRLRASATKLVRRTQRHWNGTTEDTRWFIGTVAWLIIGGLLLLQWWWRSSEGLFTNLNNVGDFFAGFVAPVTFLWLIRSYRQQAEALHLQAKELSKTVKEQRKMLAATKEQIEIDNRRRASESLARLVGRCTNSVGLEQGATVPKLTFEITPRRNPAYELRVTRVDGSQAAYSGALNPEVSVSWTESNVQPKAIIGDGMWYRITYRDVDWIEREEGIRFFVQKGALEQGVKASNTGEIRKAEPPKN